MYLDIWHPFSCELYALILTYKLRRGADSMCAMRFDFYTYGNFEENDHLDLKLSFLAQHGHKEIQII